MHRTIFSVSAQFILLLVVCLSTQALGQPQSVHIDEWARETIELPPGFAPSLPTGIEELRFPPGWRDPESDNFWSYAILLRINESEISLDRITEIFDAYYTGLMSAFGVGDRPNSLPNTVDLEIDQHDDHHFEGNMELVDGFATFERISINIKIQVRSRSKTDSIIEFRASPHSFEHAIWSELQIALDHMHKDISITPLGALKYLIGGEWRTTPTNGNQQRDVWAWGPAQQSLTSITSNQEGTSQSVFGSFRMIYDHPQREGFSVLALSGPELIQSGSLTLLEGNDLRFDMTLFYDQDLIEWAPEPTRTISSVWSFDGPNQYMNHWIKDQGVDVDPEMTGWSYTKHQRITDLPKTSKSARESVVHLGVFLPLIDSEWVSDTTRTTFHWIPYNEAIRVQTIDMLTDELMVESVLYPHPHTKEVHSITFHKSGVIDEGIASFIENTILIRAERADRSSSSPIEQLIELLDNGTMRIQTQSIDKNERALLDDHVYRMKSD